MSAQQQLVQDWWLEEAHFCGCGRPGDVMQLVREALEAHGESGRDFEGGPVWDWSDARTWLLAYCLDAWELTEHGGGVGGAWLTPKGIVLRDALRTVDFGTVLDPLPLDEERNGLSTLQVPLDLEAAVLRARWTPPRPEPTP